MAIEVNYGAELWSNIGESLRIKPKLQSSHQNKMNFNSVYGLLSVKKFELEKSAGINDLLVQDGKMEIC